MNVLITGVSGQIGSYAAEQLIEQGHEVYGLLRGQKTSWVPEGVHVLRGDLLDQSSLVAALEASEAECVYNFGALTAIGMSWGMPALVAEVTGVGVLRLLEAIRMVDKDIRMVQASSADQFGNFCDKHRVPADENTPFNPRSPYGAAKQFAHDMCVSYRNAYGMHVSTAIQFNVTSPRHGDEFVVRKVTKAVAAILNGKQKKLQLGHLDAVRDWGYAGDTAKAYPLIAAQSDPGDYVLATGEGHTLRDLVRESFRYVDLNFQDHVDFGDLSLIRPVDVQWSIGDPSKAKLVLGWKARMSFDALMMNMIHAELDGV